MSVVSRLRRTRRVFVVSITSLAICSVLALGAMLYATSVVRFHDSVSMDELYSLTGQYPEVSRYLEEQKAAEAHFVQIANLVQSEQQQLLGRVLLLSVLPVLLLGGLAGYFLAQRLLRPVEEAVTSQERFLQDAAHEIRNPLAAATAVVQQARDPKANRETRIQALEILDRQMRQLVKLNEDLLLLEQVGDPYTGKPVNISDLLGDVIDGVRPFAKEAAVKIEEDIGEGIEWPIRERDFVSISRNLIDNAIKYSPPKSQPVNVALVQRGTDVVLSIRDHGIGIPRSERGSIGNRFYRAANVGRREGTGLGIAIVEKILAQNNGTLEIESISGRGTHVAVIMRPRRSTYTRA